MYVLILDGKIWARMSTSPGQSESVVRKLFLAAMPLREEKIQKSIVRVDLKCESQVMA